MLRAGTRIVGPLARRGRSASSVAAVSGQTPDVVEVPAPPPPAVPNHRAVLTLDAHAIRPFVQPNAFVAPSASVIGSVVMNDKAAVMYGAVVRGDLGLVHIGAYSTIGDNATLSSSAIDGELSASEAVSYSLSMKPDVFVGDYSHVGPNASLASCHLEGRNVIGAGSTISPGVKIGRGSVVEPNSTVAPDTEIPPSELWGGKPARKLRTLASDEVTMIQKRAQEAYGTTRNHAYEFLPVGFGYLEREKVARSNSAKAE